MYENLVEPLEGAEALPWEVIIEHERGEFGSILSSYVAGIQDANENWMVRFDDDYGVDQAKIAYFIVKCVNENNND